MDSPRPVIRAVGGLFISLDTAECLLLQRSVDSSHPGRWSFVGGKVEKNESIHDGLMREVTEEIGFIPSYSEIVTVDNYLSSDLGFVYSSKFITVQEPFLPRLNHESDGFGWFKINRFPRNLHPGTKSVLSSELAQKFFSERFRRRD